MTDDYLYSTSAPFRTHDVLTMYSELVELVDQVSPQTAATLVAVHDRLQAIGLPYVEGFSVRFPNGLRFTRGWQSITTDSKWRHPK